MFIGRSPEEAELAGEELSVGSWLDKLKAAVSPLMPGAKKVVEIAKTPAGKAAGMYLFPQATAAMAIAHGIKHAAQGAKPQPAPAPQAPPAPPPASVGWDSRSRRRVLGGSDMGAAPPLSRAQVMALIRREPNPVKRERMIINYMRSMRR